VEAICWSHLKFYNLLFGLDYKESLMYRRIKYYLLLAERAFRLLMVYILLALVLVVASGISLTARTITLLLTLNYEPTGILDALLQILILLMELSPIVFFVDIRNLTAEKKVEIRVQCMEGHVIVVGCGHLGRRVVRALEKLGIPFVVVVKPEDRETNEEIIRLLREGKPVIFGDATVSMTLERANISKARSIIITLNNDLINPIIAEKAKKLNPKIRTVVRIFDDALAELLSKYPHIDEIISTTRTTDQFFVFGAFFDVIPEESLIIIHVDENLVGRVIREIERVGVSVVAVKHEGKWIKVPENYKLERGDIIIIVGDPNSLRVFIDRFSGKH